MYDPTAHDVDSPLPTFSETRAKAMFDRVLVSWASDLLELRRRGLTTPGWRELVTAEDGPEWRRAA